jgi:Uma2 family endonuclease
MTSAANKLASYADIEALPPHLTGQIVNGELYVSPRPSISHQETASALGGLLNYLSRFAEPPLLNWRIFHEVELHLGNDVLVPDLAGWRSDRIDRTPRAAFEVAPDWVCEILSPSTQRMDRGPKLLAYAAHGVKHIWLVHPIDRSVELFALESGGWTLRSAHHDDEVVRLAPFEEVEVPLGKIWLNPAPQAD